MEQRDILEAAGFYFIHNFDSGNLGHVEAVCPERISPSLNHRTNHLDTPDYEFNVWTRPDCYGTEFENGNRTWFYFGIQGGQSNALVRLNIINLNKQGKMYSQGMAPVTRTLPGHPYWERIKDRPVHSTDDNTFSLSFRYKTPDNLKATTFFAFTYPYSFTELQTSLNTIDQKFLPLPPMQSLDDIYYCRENLIYTLEGRRTDLMTISSYHGITKENEERLKNLFPDRTDRPLKFQDKKVIFISARVHPGETPSSFVFNGFLNLLLTRNDPIAIQLRKLYVFKLIPFLNPDGVARGHYRTDTRGVNLNRVYLNPSLELHPTVYAARAIIRYHHYGCEREEDPEDTKPIYQTYSRALPSISDETLSNNDVKLKKKPSQTKNKDDCKRRDGQLPSSSLKLAAATRSFASCSTNTTELMPSDSSQASVRGTAQSCTSTRNKLTAQVCDINLQTDGSTISVETPITSPPYMLNELVVRDCLGSEVHISRSDELATLPGANPLRQLRETLKNSISLLMSTNSYIAKSDDSNETIYPGWSSQRTEVPEIGTKEDMDPSLANTPETPNCGIMEDLKNQSVHCANVCPTRGTIAEVETEIVGCAGTAECGGDGVRSDDPALRLDGDPSEQNKTKPCKGRKKPAAVRLAAAEKKTPKEPESGLFLYIDLHGHASKKGIFMYGNHFEDTDRCVECMLLPRIMSLNNLHFHFSSCNFTERNMYLKDRRDGMSREGSGRVAVLKATGLVRSYTLECNYNTGRLVNVLPPALRDPQGTAAHLTATPPVPPKYTPHIFEEVGRSLGASILDLTSHHPNSRIPASEHRTLGALREWLRSHMRSMRPSQLTISRLRPKTSSPPRVPLYTRPTPKNKLADVERKENTYIGAKPEEAKKPPSTRSARPTDVTVAVYPTLTKKTEKFGSKTRCFVESDAKPKSLAAKRRNVLAIRKPNAGKARNLSGSKTKVKRADESAGAVGARGPKAAGSFSSRSFRKETLADSRYRGLASSSSSEEVTGGGGGAWDGGAKRRPPPPPLSIAAPRLKKIRLKTSS